MLKHVISWTSTLLVACQCAAAVDLVRNGKGGAQIVVPAGAAAEVALAAEELVLYVRKMSGATLPVVSGPTSGLAVVHLGAPDDGWADGAELDALIFDGFVVEATDARLVLAGNVPAGTLNAVYWLLEELGVRWFIPTELGEGVPKMSTVSVPSTTRRVEPCFPCRRNHGINRSIRGAGAIWRRRIRITDHAVTVPFNRYSHNLANIVRVAEHAETHPEYFPLIRGKRHIPERSYSWQPCTTNPDVVELAIAAAHRWWKKHPDANYFSVGMNDGRGWCECAECTALDIPGYTFRRRPVKSERYFAFVKQVAEAVRESHPEKYISCIAYSSVEPVPRNMTLPDNVFAVITQDVGAWHDPEYRTEDQRLAQAWTEAAGAFGVYNYTSEMWLLPRVYPHMMAESLRFYDRLGAVAITNEAWPTWWYAGPMMYLRAKLMWDPRQDPDAVLDDFYGGFFGPARGPMKRLYDRFEACTMKERKGKWFYGISSVPDQIALWTPADLDACVADLAAAGRLATQAPYQARVDFVARGFALTDAILREYWQGERVREAVVKQRGKADVLVDEIETFFQLTVRREEIMAKVMQDELLSGIYERLVNERAGRLGSWQGDLESALGAGVGALLALGHQMSAERLDELAAAGGDRIAKQLRAVVWVRENPTAPNLCPNPGFEETAGEAPEGVDWITAGTPPKWSTWSIAADPGRLSWERSGGRGDSHCAMIRGAQLSTFIATFPVTPGECYHVSVWVRSTGSEAQIPKLAVKWQKAEGGWVCPEENVDVSGSGGAGDWQPLSSVVEVPEGAGQLLIMPRVRDQQPDDVVRFDDASIVRLPDLGE
ncbi:MAG: DUF4838 domain-containing protein [Lentisphaerae bacterium]|jgi:hypothetical protein|nr:DUF4838 domain-containing protein [Lentisphaerota bacterium]MBT4816514.1 DUF4838 domain-containing protein [Lentisphaerota bacterium]MBT5609214.1 DUF4838 domain-containing protein [Lentisphaerota bacterium]MBT7060052.1 DUF4838 domain-containing protein [Lentisphaerota bacterium]MBT7847140.1 DUF4838 domain-containing protein [Lentisphaerota bacterium]